MRLSTRWRKILTVVLYVFLAVSILQMLVLLAFVLAPAVSGIQAPPLVHVVLLYLFPAACIVLAFYIASIVMRLWKSERWSILAFPIVIALGVSARLLMRFH